MCPAPAAAVTVLQEEKQTMFFKPLYIYIYIEESLELNFYPKLISKCCARGKFCFYVISPNAWTPCGVHGGYVVAGETILGSRSISTEQASHAVSGAQAVNGAGPQRGDG